MGINKPFQSMMIQDSPKFETIKEVQSRIRQEKVFKYFEEKESKIQKMKPNLKPKQVKCEPTKETLKEANIKVLETKILVSETGLFDKLTKRQEKSSIKIAERQLLKKKITGKKQIGNTTRFKNKGTRNSVESKVAILLERNNQKMSRFQDTKNSILSQNYNNLKASATNSVDRNEIRVFNKSVDSRMVLQKRVTCFEPWGKYNRNQNKNI